MLWPKAGFTKAEAIDYYARIAEVMLPHLKGRPLTRVRFPDGVEGQRFFEKRAPSHTPKWVKTAPMEMGTAGTIDFILCNDRATLIWLAQLAALELHPSLALAKKPERPTVLAFDLDPGAPATAVECAQVALRLRDLFAGFELECFAKHSGSKGIQVYVPLNTAVTYEQTKPFARRLAELLEQRLPERVTADMAKAKRRGKVLVDWSQNDYSKTTVAVYSLRNRPRPWVSMPLTWDEVADLADGDDPESVRFLASEVLERVEKHGDLFAPVLELKQKLPKAPA